MRGFHSKTAVDQASVRFQDSFLRTERIQGFFSALELKRCKGLTSFHTATMFRAQIFYCTLVEWHVHKIM